MIWKIVFIIYTLLFLLLQIGGITNTLKISEFTLAAGYILTIALTFIGGYFYSLGWNKKLFSLKANNIIFGFLILYLLIIAVMSGVTGHSTLVLNHKFAGRTDIAPALAKLFLITAVVYIALAIPLISAFISYKKRFAEMKETAKPYWKLFLTYFYLRSTVNSIYYLIYGSPEFYNLWDFLIMAASLLNIFFAIGYSCNLKFGKQIIWKILFVPYTILMFLSVFLCSDSYQSISGMYVIKVSYAGLIAAGIYAIFILYAFYRYAYSGDVYNIEIKED